MRSILLLALVICTVMVVNGGVVKRSDDVNTDIQTLQTLVQQQAAAISSLQATVNSLQTADNSQQAAINSQQVTITGLESKVQTLSKSVAFTARFAQNEMMNGVPLTQIHQILVFDYVIANAGNAYDPTTGIFTAPLAGYYDFSLVAMEPVGPSHYHLDLSIVRNDRIVGLMWVTNNQNDIDEQGSTETVMHLAVGDQVWIRREGGDAVRGSFWTVFTGFLVHAD